MLGLLISLLVPAHAIVMEPTYQAADSLGYQTVGEIEFEKDSFRIPPAQMRKQIGEIGEMCPRTQAYDPNISSFARFVILSWSDADYPTRAREFHSAHQQWLAQKRAIVIAEKIRSEVRGTLDFELVNMANRRPHLITASPANQSARPKQDVKSAMESAGAAPSDPLGFGLFAEYSQAAKAVIWVECRESLVRKKSAPPSMVQLASLGHRFQR